MHKVLLVNDDYTPMNFVVGLLVEFFGMNKQKAEASMLQIHTQGQAVCGIYTKDIAETKVSQVMQKAEQSDFPLLCKMERN